MGCQYGQIHNSLYKRRYNKKLNTLSKPLRKGRFCYAKSEAKNRAKNVNGSKACAWLAAAVLLCMQDGQIVFEIVEDILQFFEEIILLNFRFLY